jgi:hypothetical protein
MNAKIILGIVIAFLIFVTAVSLLGAAQTRHAPRQVIGMVKVG